MDQRAVKRYFFFGLLFFAVGFVTFLLWPFIKIIILSVVFTTLLYPVYSWFLRKITRNTGWLSSLLTIIFFFIVVCVPLAFIVKAVTHQVQGVLAILSAPSKTAAFLRHIGGVITAHFPWAPFNIDAYMIQIARSVTASFGNIVSIVLSTLFNALLLILTMFYFLKDGGHWHDTLVNLSPLSNESTEQILIKLKLAINGVFRGYFVVALAQGILLGVGLWIFGVPNPALFGLLAGIASLIPTFGTALVSIPSVLYLFATGQVAPAIALAIWAAFLVGSIDNILNPYVVGKSVAIHPLLILFSVLGGMSLMGPVGIVLGPLAISFLFAVTSVYSSEMKREE